MGRIRTIKPEFVQSENLGRCSRDARLLFILLFTMVDDHGRGRAASRMLASSLFPYDEDAPGLIDGWLDELESVESIVRYIVDGSVYLEIPKWAQHQKVDRPSASKFPPYDAKHSTRLASIREGSRVPREGSCEDQGSRTKEGIKDQGSRRERGDAKMYAFAGKVIRLTQEHFDAWKKSYSAIDLVSKLQHLDDWFGAQPPEDRKNWFIRTSQMLAKDHEAATENAKKAKRADRPWERQAGPI